MENSPKKQLVHVVAAVIRAGDLILCARRAPHKDLAGLWEFPGGKVEPLESPQEALVRELKEELQLSPKIGGKFGETLTQSGQNEILIVFFEVLLEKALEVKSTDHDLLEWRPAAQLIELDWAPADVPIVKKLVLSP